MKAAVIEEFGASLVLQDVPDPTPGPDDAVVQIKASGICRTDLKVQHGVIPTTPLPHIGGHEIAGEIVALGSNATTAGHAMGDRVIVDLNISCLACEYCNGGNFVYCANLRRIGMEEDGGFAELVVAPVRNLVPIPDGISYVQAAPLPDAVATPYRGVMHHGQVQPGQDVAIYGLGGLGLTAVQIAAHAGARVIAIARTPERRELAIELGAADTVNPNDGPVSGQILEMTAGLGVHAFIDIVGIEGTAEQALLASRKGGRIVIVGYVVPQTSVTSMQMVLKEATVVGSRGATAADLDASIQLVAEGAVSAIIDRTIALEDINTALADLEAGSIVGRAIVTH